MSWPHTNLGFVGFCGTNCRHLICLHPPLHYVVLSSFMNVNIRVQTPDFNRTSNSSSNQNYTNMFLLFDRIFNDNAASNVLPNCCQTFVPVFAPDQCLYDYVNKNVGRPRRCPRVWWSWFSIFTSHRRARLDYLQQVRSTAGSDPLSGVCRRLRALRLLDSLGRKQTEKHERLRHVTGAGVTYTASHLCRIHRYLSQSPLRPEAGWQNQAAAPVQTLTAAKKKTTPQNSWCYETQWNLSIF